MESDHLHWEIRVKKKSLLYYSAVKILQMSSAFI